MSGCYSGLRYSQQCRRAEKAEQAQIRAQEENEIWSLLYAEPKSVPSILTSLEESRSQLMPLPRLRALQCKADLPEKQRIRVHLALLPSDPSLIGSLKESLLKADPQDFGLIRERLLPYSKTLKEDLWKLVENPNPEIRKDQRFRAACALALYDPDDHRWNGMASAKTLIAENHHLLGEWMEALRPAHHALLAPLIDLFRNSQEPEVRNAAANILAEFGADQVDVLADMITSDLYIRPKPEFRNQWRNGGKNGLLR